MKLGGLQLGEAVNCFWLLFVFLAVPSESAQAKTTSVCARLTQKVTLNLTCDPGQHISIDDVLAGDPAADCRVNRSVECSITSPNITQLPQVIACNGLRSCYVTVNFAITCSTKHLSLYAVEILYWCLEQDVKSSMVPKSDTVPTSSPSQHMTSTALRISESTTTPASDEVPTVFPTLNIEPSTLPNKDTMLSSLRTTDDATSTGPRDQTTVQSAVLPVFLLATSVVMGVLVIAVLAVLCVMCGCRKCRLTHNPMATASQRGHIIPMPVPKNLVGTTWQENVDYWELDPTDVHNVSPVTVESDTGYAETQCHLESGQM